MTTSAQRDAAPISLLGILVRRGASLIRRGNAYVIDGPPAKLTGTRVDGRIVESAVASGWVASDGLRWRITEAGALALRRGATRPATTPDRDPRTRPGRTDATTSTGLHTLERLRNLRDAKGRPILTGAQVEAGLRLAADFTRGSMQPRVTLDWSFSDLGTAAPRGNPSGAMDVSDRAEAARERHRRALDAVGPEFADLLMDVCCFDTGLEAVEGRRGWPARSARIVLGLGLDRLARHYGTVSEVPSRRSIIGVWTAPSEPAG